MDALKVIIWNNWPESKLNESCNCLKSTVWCDIIDFTLCYVEYINHYLKQSYKSDEKIQYSIIMHLSLSFFFFSPSPPGVRLLIYGHYHLYPYLKNSYVYLLQYIYGPPLKSSADENSFPDLSDFKILLPKLIWVTAQSWFSWNVTETDGFKHQDTYNRAVKLQKILQMLMFYLFLRKLILWGVCIFCHICWVTLHEKSTWRSKFSVPTHSVLLTLTLQYEKTGKNTEISAETKIGDSRHNTREALDHDHIPTTCI